jgi:DMSO/TMAO reductase YedYZ molybdopterin-dependent catalytic subunit
VRRGPKTGFLVFCVMLAMFTFLPAPRKVDAQEASGELRIYGAVNNPLNLTYAELLSFPMVSEVARLECVVGTPNVTYNWTGVPLFYLLTLAQIKPEAYKIATISHLGGFFSSDLLVEDALRPTTILALEANGTSLPNLTNSPTGLNRLVVPGKYGYKWVSGLDEINVTTTDYVGTYEGAGVPSWTDEADVPDYGPPPTITPPLQAYGFLYGNRTFKVDAFTNASITAAFNPSQKALNMNMTVLQGTSGFVDFILQQDFLKGPYNVTVDGKTITVIEGDTNTTSYLYMAIHEGFHTASISGTESVHIPEIVVYYQATTNVGENVTFDASNSVDIGTIVSYNWSFGDGAETTGAIVSHSYNKPGTYQVGLNVTNNDGISSFKTLTITVKLPQENTFLPLKVILAAILALLILMFAFLLITRKKEVLPSSRVQPPDTVQKAIPGNCHGHHKNQDQNAPFTRIDYLMILILRREPKART